jgi:hypothetical protein
MRQYAPLSGMNPASKLPSALNKVDAEVVFLPVGFTERA